MFTPNEAIDIWIVERALGQGGMGSVYRCHNRDARRILAAIKVLDYGLKRSPKARARFVREAEILCALDHPNIVKARNVRLDVDPPYIEMEFVEATSLERRIGEGRLDAQWVLGALKQLAGALEYMHGRGIRHRDIKPSNVLARDDGTVVLVDFGIATEEDGSTLTDQGSAMGSVAYVPPEWVLLSRPDPVKWDLYALGVVAYEALSGQAAFETPSGGMNAQRFHQVLQAKQNHAPLDPGGQVPVGLRAVVRDLTRSKPEDRLETAAELSRRLGLVDLAHVDPAFRFFDAGPAERTIVPESELGGGSLPPEPGESPVPARPRPRAP
ncbi:MAG: serine/threonine protein kinase, partial [Deltaproteobacteria bacterium]|nr:serine/threonine protein kinase [Deltaproteobacteria bacterium]